MSRSNSSSTFTAPKYFCTLSNLTGTFGLTLTIPLTFHRAQQNALGDKPLQQDGHEDDRNNHHHDHGAHLPPEDAFFTRILGLHHDRHGLHPGDRQEHREE